VTTTDAGADVVPSDPGAVRVVKRDERDAGLASRS